MKEESLLTKDTQAEFCHWCSLFHRWCSLNFVFINFYLLKLSVDWTNRKAEDLTGETSTSKRHSVNIHSNLHHKAENKKIYKEKTWCRIVAVWSKRQLLYLSILQKWWCFIICLKQLHQMKLFEKGHQLIEQIVRSYTKKTLKPNYPQPNLLREHILSRKLQLEILNNLWWETKAS